jgi:8-oxo-dGTP pyrophosphatase MutT (NUDIX family)
VALTKVRKPLQLGAAGGGPKTFLKKPIKRGLGRQFAALPLKDYEGDTLVMLVTTRETGRWVLPKGWAEKGLTGSALAAKEAFEEAGVIGKISNESVGTYRYTKQLPQGQEVECEVKVFSLQVEQLLDDWPEREQRARKWFTLAQAAMAANDGDLIALLLRLAAPKP